MADKWNRDNDGSTRDSDESMTGAADERVRGVSEDDEFEADDAGDMDDEEDEEGGGTF